MEPRSTRFRLERGPVPLHHQVYLDLAGALAAGEWQRGDRLPPERGLAERYGCSLITVRRALGELTREGRLERTRGRGTFVVDPPIVRDIRGPSGFAAELRSLGYEPFTVVVAVRTEIASPATARALDVPAGSAVHYLERIRGANGTPLLLEQVSLPAASLPGLLDRDFAAEESLWEVLRRDYGIQVSRRREQLNAIVPDAREARLLRLRSRRPALLLEGIAFTADGRPIESSRTVVSPERAGFYVESTDARLRLVSPLEQNVPAEEGVR